MLIAGGSGAVTVSIASPRRGRVQLELEIAMQTCFFRDARYVVLPEAWGPLARTTLRTIGKPSDELAEACGAMGDGTWVSFAAPEVARRRSGDRLGAFAGRLVTGEDHLVRVEVDLAATLADVPRDLATVLVVDGSRSMTDAQREAQRELVVSFGFGTSGSCCGGGSFSSQSSIGIGTTGRGSHYDPDDLTAQLAPAVAACQLGDERARVQLEMTLLEIVDVTVEIDARSRTNPNELRKLRACVEDVIWDASPMLRIPRSHSQHAATFGEP